MEPRRVKQLNTQITKKTKRALEDAIKYEKAIATARQET